MLLFARGFVDPRHFAVRFAERLCPSGRRFAFLINTGREITGLAQLADRFIGRSRLQPTRSIPVRGNPELRN